MAVWDARLTRWCAAWLCVSACNSHTHAHTSRLPAKLKTASAADIALPNSESTPVIHQNSDNAFQMLSAAETKANRKRPAPPATAPLAVLNAGLPEEPLQMVLSVEKKDSKKN